MHCRQVHEAVHGAHDRPLPGRAQLCGHRCRHPGRQPGVGPEEADLPPWQSDLEARSKSRRWLAVEPGASPCLCQGDWAVIATFLHLYLNLHFYLYLCLHQGEQANEEKQAGKPGGEPGLPAQPESSLEGLPLIFSSVESWSEGHAGQVQGKNWCCSSSSHIEDCEEEGSEMSLVSLKQTLLMPWCHQKC